MRCYICDRVLDEPVFNRDLEMYEACDTCLSVIHDTAGSFIDRPSAAEDELPDEGPLHPASSPRQTWDD